MHGGFCLLRRLSRHLAIRRLLRAVVGSCPLLPPAVSLRDFMLPAGSSFRLYILYGGKQLFLRLHNKLHAKPIPLLVSLFSEAASFFSSYLSAPDAALSRYCTENSGDDSDAEVVIALPFPSISRGLKRK